MKKGALTVIAAVLLLLFGLFHIGAGIGQFGKGELLKGSTSAMSSFGESLANSTPGNPFAGGLRSDSRNLRAAGESESSKLYLIAFFILATAVLQIVASIGMFGRKSWAFRVVVAAAICGILVEFQDITEDGLGAGQLIFLFVYALVLYATVSAREVVQVATSSGGAAWPYPPEIVSPPTPSLASDNAAAVAPSIRHTLSSLAIIAQRECSYCEAVADLEDEFCAECGKRLVGSSAERKCSKCGTSAGQEDGFCAECGNPLA
jgi:hypothetical protein